MTVVNQMKSIAIGILCLLIATHSIAQEKGTLKDTIVCTNNNQQTYALYLPKSFSTEKEYGLIIFFEPGGRAPLPLTLYQEVADKHSLILACSYKSRNGPTQISVDAGYAVLADLRSKFSIDKNKIWLSGFSGGARVATFLAIQDNQFAGVIACGAAFPTKEKITKQRSIPFSEIIGMSDMNYVEAVRANKYLSEINNPCLLIQFYGGHDWPLGDYFDQALRWHLIQKNFLLGEERTLFFTQLTRSAKNEYDSGLLHQSYRSLSQPITNALPNELKKLDSLKVLISSHPRYEKDKALFEKALETEDQFIRDFLTRFNKMMQNARVDSLFKESEWSIKRKTIDRLVRSEEKYKHQSGTRLFDFCWRRCAEQYGIFIESQEYDNAALAAKIWAAFAPENPWPSVLAAKALALNGATKESILFLQQAVKRGFRKKEFLLSEQAFKSISGMKGFQKILDQLQ